MKPVDIRPGVVIRVIASHGLGAPVGSLATVKAIETSRSGDWLCIVQYHDTKPPRQGTRLYRSHLWVSDLGRFEIVKDATSISITTNPNSRQRRIQLLLPFDDAP
jgi:hypothetical protein